MAENRRLHILLLASWFPHEGATKLGNFVHRHAQAIAQKHNVSVLYLAPQQGNAPTRLVHYSLEGIDTTWVYYSKKGVSIFSRLRAFRLGLDALVNERKITFDLIHLNVIWPEGWQAIVAQRRLNIPIVITEHWTGYHETSRGKQPFKVKALSRWVASKASVICPVSDDLGQAMRRFGLSGKYLTVPNVVNTDVFQLAEKQAKPLQFLHVSSLYEPQKNIRGILRVWKKFADQYPDVHLTIGGDGPWQDALKYAQDLNIRPNSITVFGEKEWNEIAALMQQAHVLLLFSNFENLPCVIVEAMASGMHVISSAVGGISEHISAEVGLLVPHQDEQALFDALAKIYTNYPLTNATQLRAIAEQKFSMQSIAQQFDHVYQIALSTYSKS
jgi:glycosyltransferase involved in cell wall biosynthesis